MDGGELFSQVVYLYSSTLVRYLVSKHTRKQLDLREGWWTAQHKKNLLLYQYSQDKQQSLYKLYKLLIDPYKNNCCKVPYPIHHQTRSSDSLIPNTSLLLDWQIHRHISYKAEIQFLLKWKFCYDLHFTCIHKSIYCIAQFNFLIYHVLEGLPQYRSRFGWILPHLYARPGDIYIMFELRTKI